jgi:N-acetylglucosaminyl-diphospho-decaprenol L-rhamnosyltransferase
MIGIVVVNYASHRLLALNLGDLAVVGLAARVIVVDNFSDAAERGQVARLARQHAWELVAMPDNRGFGAAVNAGAARAEAMGCDCLLFLNPDAVVTADVVEALRQQVLREPAALISPRIVDSTGAVVFQGTELLLADGQMRGLGRKPAHPSPHERAELWLTGACMAVPLELFTRLGGYDESYFLYWEDVDLSYRAVRAGAQLIVRDDLVVVHDEGGTHTDAAPDGRAKSSTYYRYNCRNRLLFAVRNLSRADRLRWVVRTPAASWEILTRGGRWQLLQSRQPLMATLRGSVAGLWLVLKSLPKA